MSDADNKEVTLSLKVMINKERNKVLFAVADNHFVDILLSFLTLPLGRIVKVLEKHYGDEAPTVGSLRSLYRSLANLDSSHFWTDGAKQTLLKPSSSFDAEYAKLKVDISDSPPFEYFNCFHNPASCNNSIRSVSLYYDTASCRRCSVPMKKIRKEESAKKGCEGDGGVLTCNLHKATFIISDDLQIFSNEMGMLRIFDILGITDVHKVEEIQVALGFNEIMNLLKASLTSPTPLSDVILSKTRLMKYSPMVEPQPMIVKEENLKPKTLSLKVMIQKSTGRLLYAEAREDFVDFLFSLLVLPLGGVEHLMSGKTSCKAIDNLYRTTSELLDEYFMSPDTKDRVTKPYLPHGYISEKHILPLTIESLTIDYKYLWMFSSANFPKGQGCYLFGPRNYHVTDDLTVTPFCIVSVISDLNDLNVPLSEVKEVELEIGLKEALSLLRASLTSTSAITDGLLNHISNIEI